MTSCFAIIEFIVFTPRSLRSIERKCQEGVRLRSRLRVNGHPIDALPIPLQDPILDHVTPYSCGVIVVLGNDEVEFLLGILSGGR